jgi:AcrR family transcriptional regulator
MYHISKDKRCEASAEQMYEGLEKAMAIKAFDDISISDIQKYSYVARTTFYRSFDTISDILYWKCDVCFKEVLRGFAPQEFMNEVNLLRHYLSYWMKHSEILEQLMAINRIDIIYSCHMKNAEELAKEYGAIPNMDEVSSRYFMAVRTGLTISVLTAWLKGGKKETPDQIQNLLNINHF